MCTELTDKSMHSIDVISAAKAAAVVGMCRSRVCHVGSRKVSEKASALVLIGIEWQNDTDSQDGKLRRKTHVIDKHSSLSTMLADVHALVGIRFIDI